MHEKKENYEPVDHHHRSSPPAYRRPRVSSTLRAPPGAVTAAEDGVESPTSPRPTTGPVLSASSTRSRAVTMSSSRLGAFRSPGGRLVDRGWA